MGWESSIMVVDYGVCNACNACNVFFCTPTKYTLLIITKIPVILLDIQLHSYKHCKPLILNTFRRNPIQLLFRYERYSQDNGPAGPLSYSTPRQLLPSTHPFAQRIGPTP